MKITVVGAGYVGMANAALLALTDEVCLLDIDSSRVEAVNAGRPSIEDRLLEEWMRRKQMNLRATTDSLGAYSGARFVVVAVPTDYDEATHCFDTRIVETVVKEAVGLEPAATIVIRSTVPVGFTSELARQYPETEFLFAPEFLREGTAFADSLAPSRVVVGGTFTEAQAFARLLIGSSAPIHLTTTTEAEATKLFANTYLAMRVAFFNELDTFAMHAGIDARTLVNAVAADPRIGTGYNNPSFGYGGYCLPKDTKQLEHNYDDVPQTLISAIVSANETRKTAIAHDILEHGCRTVGIFRLAMKAGSDNARESAVLDVIDLLQNAGVEVIVYEPAMEHDAGRRWELVNDMQEFLERSELVVANRRTPELNGVDRVYTRDLTGEG